MTPKQEHNILIKIILDRYAEIIAKQPKTLWVVVYNSVVEFKVRSAMVTAMYFWNIDFKTGQVILRNTEQGINLLLMFLKGIDHKIFYQGDLVSKDTGIRDKNVTVGTNIQRAMFKTFFKTREEAVQYLIDWFPNRL